MYDSAEPDPEENVRMKAELEREGSGRRTLQLQLESKEQSISGLKAQMEALTHQARLQNTQYKKVR